MSLPFTQDPSSLPMNVLFPEQYEASKRMIARDFAFIGASIVFGVIGIVTLFG